MNKFLVNSRVASLGKYFFLVMFLQTIIYSNQARGEQSLHAPLNIYADLLLPKVSQITIGIGPSLSPDYVGSDDYLLKPKLAFYVTVEDYLTLSASDATINIVGSRRFQLGPTLNITGPRYEKTNAALDGLGDIKRSLNLGLYGKLILTDTYSLRARFYDDVIGGNNGKVLDFTVGALVMDRDNFSAAVGLKVNWISKKRAQTFFGVSNEQALRSGLQTYTVNSSFSEIMSEFDARWQLSEKWSLNFYAKASHLLGSAARSPLVKYRGSSKQVLFGTFISYTFDMSD